MPSNTKLTLDQAAAHLGIRRSTLERLLQQGKIPCTEVDGIFMVALQDLIDYEKTANEAGRQILRTLTQEAVSDGTYFARPHTTQTR